MDGDGTIHADVAFDAIHTELAELRSRLDLPAWRNPANLIAGLAFALSLSTSLFSIHAGRVKDAHDLENELATVTEKLAALPLTRADFLARHSTARFPDADYINAGMANDIFIGETSMFALEGYHLALKLGSTAATPELLQVATALESTNNITRAVTMRRLALANADNWYDEFAARNFLERALLEQAPTPDVRAEAQKVYDDEQTIGDRYPALADNPGLLKYELTYGESMWGQALMPVDCGAATQHLQHALDLFTTGGVGAPTAGVDYIRYDLAQCAPKAG